MHTLRNKVVILLSGGIDSTVLLYLLIACGYDVIPLYINYGQLPYTGEIAAIKRILPINLLDRLVVVDLPGIRDLGSGSLVGEYPINLSSKEQWFKSEFFPNRNMILISLAAAYCHKNSIQNIAVGFVGKNSYCDTTRSFVEAMHTALKVSVGDITIIAPYIEQSREVVVRDALKYNVPVEITFSCNSLSDRHCLFCVSCYEREQVINCLRDFHKKK